MFATKFTAVFAALAAAATAVSAAPATFTGGKVEIVYRPHVIAPQAGDVWPVGSTQTITWDTSDIPEEAKNQTGLVLLGYIEDGSENEHLDVGHPLAVRFPIADGKTEVTVPDVPTRDDYVIVLFGDSGNTSPKFTIQGSAVSSAVPSVSAVSTPAVPSVALPTSFSLPTSLPSVSAVSSA
ncbi:hypothetical protein C8Q77DRAFT_910051 [Trametes polyzona]|nr:hypothetical protein C8Q77DRAFT_910051 [Trametes polyzona]